MFAFTLKKRRGKAPTRKITSVILGALSLQIEKPSYKITFFSSTIQLIEGLRKEQNELLNLKFFIIQ